MSRSSYTNPVENIRSYVMVHGGFDREERLTDVEYISDVMIAARELVNSFGDEFEPALEKLRAALRA